MNQLSAKQAYELWNNCPRELKNHPTILIAYLSNLHRHKHKLPNLKQFLDSDPEVVALLGLIWPNQSLEEGIKLLNNSGNNLALARLFYKKGDYNQALFFYDACSDFYSDNIIVLMEIVLTCYANGQYDKAYKYSSLVYDLIK